ncbi:MAG TPA: cytochrome c biogenesis protein ResB [Kineosporiaceae bacterium]
MVDVRTGKQAARSAPAEQLETFLPETEQDAPAAPARLGLVGWSRWTWRQLTSMRTALLLLLLLAVAALPGSVFPQRRIDTGRVQQYLSEHRASGPWLDRLGFFDVYTSPWFSAVYLLLFVSLVGCVLPRSRRHLAAVRSAPPRTPRRLARMPEHAVRVVDDPVADVVARAREVLRARRYRIALHDGGTSVAGEKGYLAETGNLLFHLALLALLVSVGAGLFTGYGGQVLVIEGSTFANALPMYNSFTSGSRVTPADLPPFSFTLDKLAVRFEDRSTSQLGAPREFTATVTVRDRPGAAPRTETVQVNKPLQVDGAKAYLAGNGYAPVVSVRDGTGAVVLRGPVPALVTDAEYTSTVVIKVPDARPRQLGLAGTLVPTGLRQPGEGWISIFPDALAPRLVLTAFAAAPGQDGLGVNSGVPQSVYSLDVSRLTQLRTSDGQPARLLLKPGETATLPDNTGSITFEGLRRYASFDISSDPTKGWALGSALLALAGVTASLFVRRRRVWIRVSTDGEGRTVVEAAGLARGEDAGLGDEVRAVFEGATRADGVAGRRTVRGERE